MMNFKIVSILKIGKILILTIIRLFYLTSTKNNIHDTKKNYCN